MLSATRPKNAGFDRAQFSQTIEITTGGGIIAAPLISLPSMEALRQTRSDFAVLAHDLPVTSKVDGVLGLDFMRGHLLTTDFRIGQLSLV